MQLSGLHSTAIIGNRAEIVDDEDGNSYLYIAQNTGTIFWRLPLFAI